MFIPHQEELHQKYRIKINKLRQLNFDVDNDNDDDDENGAFGRRF